MRHFYLSASFISYPICHQDLNRSILYYVEIGEITRFWHCVFLPVSEKIQLYGTSRCCAPEILRGRPVLRLPTSTVSAGFLTELFGRHVRCSNPASVHLRAGMRRSPADRCQEACDLKAALLRVPLSENQQSSHLIRNIAVIGSRPGAGATHISISLVSTALNQKHIPRHLYCRGRGAHRSTPPGQIIV